MNSLVSPYTFSCKFVEFRLDIQKTRKASEMVLRFKKVKPSTEIKLLDNLLSYWEKARKMLLMNAQTNFESSPTTTEKILVHDRTNQGWEKS